ncbi:hypothetical protein Droror1_Dr00018220 [Drosera rotundifolia]
MMELEAKRKEVEELCNKVNQQEKGLLSLTLKEAGWLHSCGAILIFPSLTEDEVPDVGAIQEMMSKKTKLVVIPFAEQFMERLPKTVVVHRSWSSLCCCCL